MSASIQFPAFHPTADRTAVVPGLRASKVATRFRGEKENRVLWQPVGSTEILINGGLRDELAGVGNIPN